MALAATAARAGVRKGKPALHLYYSNYAAPSVPVSEMLDLIRQTGYDGAELCCTTGWPSEPALLSADARRKIRDSGFPIHTLMQNFNLMASAEAQTLTLEKIKLTAALAHDLSPAHPTTLQTVLGGKPQDWPASQRLMADRLAEWTRAAAAAGITLAVKGHASSAIDKPDKLLWLLNHVNQPATLTANYDYSHFQLANLHMEQTMDQLLPRSALITVKDSKIVDGQPRFVLPGDGSIDYTRYFRKVKQLNWSGWVLVEVSSNVFKQPGYDPAQAARHCYANLAPVLRALQLR
jgi:sugar phosphate isomerase/epimerase